MNKKAAVKMQLKLYQLGGAALCVLLAAPVKALPVFDTWSAASGTITVPTNCAAGFTCETLTTGNGFAQVQWTSATEGTFIQTIITNQDATGDNKSTTPLIDPPAFFSESFVKRGGDSGIYSQQVLFDNTTNLGTEFTTSTLQNSGWANSDPGVLPDMTVLQTIQTGAEPDLEGDNFHNEFNMELTHDASGTGAVEGRSISIIQDVGLGTAADASTVDNIQSFRATRLTGTALAAGQIDLDATVFDSNNQPLNGGTVSWADGDDVMIRWIGQRIALTQGASSLGTSLFGYEGITKFDSSGNIVTPNGEAATFSTTSTGIVVDGTDPQLFGSPFDWDIAFGATPPTIP